MRLRVMKPPAPVKPKPPAPGKIANQLAKLAASCSLLGMALDRVITIKGGRND